ncbi:MAG: iron transport system permease [Pseudomonadota bacterium]|jgi:iron(III) transport system permease protein
MSRQALLATLCVVFVVAIAMPLLAVVAIGLKAWADWSALASMVQSVLPTYLLNSLLLCLGALGVSIVVGVAPAWFLTQYSFAGRGLLQWLPVLPMAMPAYVVAYALTDALDYSGWVATLVRPLWALWFGLDPMGRVFWPEIRSLWGASLVLGLALSPYVYLLVRTAFEDGQGSLLEAARSLGLTRRAAFFRLALPLVRPAIVAGSALVVMECLADYGTVAFFSVQTLSTGLFKAWFNYGDPHGAALLGLLMLGSAVTLLSIERRSRGRAEFVAAASRRVAPQPLRGVARIWVPIVCAASGVLGFFLPAGLLVKAALEAESETQWPSLLGQALQTGLYGVYALAIILPIAVVLAYGARIWPRGWMATAVRWSSSGYAVPGLVVAVGLLSLSALLTDRLDAWLDWRMTLTTTSALVLGGYLTRFFTVGFSSVESSLSRIKESLDWSARSLGLSVGQVLTRLHLPMLRRGVFVAALLVFVDVVKELPVTLVLRPMNVETLAVAAHHLAADERLADAAWPSLAIAVVGLIPVLLLGPRAK